MFSYCPRKLTNAEFSFPQLDLAKRFDDVERKRHHGGDLR